MQTSEGQTVGRVVMTIDGIEYDVMTLKQAGKNLQYSSSSMWRFVDEGKLIAYKIAGAWWVRIDGVNRLELEL